MIMDDLNYLIGFNTNLPYAIKATMVLKTIVRIIKIYLLSMFKNMEFGFWSLAFEINARLRVTKIKVRRPKTQVHILLNLCNLWMI